MEAVRGRLRRMEPKHWYLVFGTCSLLAVACSDSKPASSGNAHESTGNESKSESVTDRVNSAHESFKEEIRPAAGWVDDRSHRVADEAVNAASKGKKTLEGDGDHDHDHAHDGDHDHDHAHDTTGAATNGN